jgi:hypothetical protein
MDYIGHEPLDPSAATEMIRGIARFGAIRHSWHCRQQSMPDSDFSYQDLVAILLNGEVHEPPEYDETTCQYRYKMKGETIDGDTATIILVIVDHRSLVVITVF